MTRRWKRLHCLPRTPSPNLVLLTGMGARPSARTCEPSIEYGFQAHITSPSNTWEGGSLKIFRAIRHMKPDDSSKTIAKPVDVPIFYWTKRNPTKVSSLDWSGWTGSV